MELLKTSRVEDATASCPPGYWEEWWEKQQNPQGSQWNNCRPWWCHGFKKAPSNTTSITSLEGLPEESLVWLQDTEESASSLPNVIYIMSGTRCSGQMRPKLNVFVRYSLGMFGVGTEMHTRRSTSYPQWNMVVSQSCFGAVLIPEVQGHNEFHQVSGNFGWKSGFLCQKPGTWP